MHMRQAIDSQHCLSTSSMCGGCSALDVSETFDQSSSQNEQGTVFNVPWLRPITATFSSMPGAKMAQRPHILR